jgi:hypothetical protein
MVLKDSTKISIIGCLWRANPQLVIKGFIGANKDTSHLIRISAVCNELKVRYDKAHYMDQFSQVLKYLLLKSEISCPYFDILASV